MIPTPLTDANVAKLTKTPDCFCEADFARDLERKLAEAREALEWAMDTQPSPCRCLSFATPPHVCIAHKALARIDAPGASLENSPPPDESAESQG